MTDIATLIRTLGAAGAPAEAIALAVEAIEAVAETQRAAARERKRRQRAREAAAGDVTGQAAPASSPLMSPASPDPSTPLNPPTEHTQTARGAREKSRLRRGRPKRLKREWQPAALPPDDHDMVVAWPPGMWERELARFRDHFKATGGTSARKHDWDAAWRNWLREADDERPRPRDPRGNPRARNGDDGAGEPASALVRAGLARLRHAGGA